MLFQEDVHADRADAQTVHHGHLTGQGPFEVDVDAGFLAHSPAECGGRAVGGSLTGG